MRNHVGFNRRRPGVDSLENRYLLSASFEGPSPFGPPVLVSVLGQGTAPEPSWTPASPQATGSQSVVLVVGQSVARPAFPFGVDQAAVFAPLASGFGYSPSGEAQPAGLGMIHAEAVTAASGGFGLGRVEVDPAFRFASDNGESDPIAALAEGQSGATVGASLTIATTTGAGLNAPLSVSSFAAAPPMLWMDHGPNLMHIDSLHMLSMTPPPAPKPDASASTTADFGDQNPTATEGANSVDMDATVVSGSTEYVAVAHDSAPSAANPPVTVAIARSPVLLGIDHRNDARPTVTLSAGEAALSMTQLDRKVAADVSPKAVLANDPAASASLPSEPGQGLNEAGRAPLEVPAPQSAGLIDQVLPLDRAALQEALDHFFDNLEDLGTGQFVWESSEARIPVSIALVVAGTALEVARRRIKRGAEENGSPRGRGPERLDLFGFPELPGPWSTRVT